MQRKPLVFGLLAIKRATRQSIHSGISVYPLGETRKQLLSKRIMVPAHPFEPTADWIVKTSRNVIASQTRAIASASSYRPKNA